MQPFGIADPAATTHTPGATCAGCTEMQYPRACPRVSVQAGAPVLDATGTLTVTILVETPCPGHSHAERISGTVQVRCDVCGMGGDKAA